MVHWTRLGAVLDCRDASQSSKFHVYDAISLSKEIVHVLSRLVAKRMEKVKAGLFFHCALSVGGLLQTVLIVHLPWYFGRGRHLSRFHPTSLHAGS